ncbi:MAG TPA: TetR/AcrR family transcriptional regulator [Candidatus Angelobacter sp.]|jgi:TetR/AcrR family transcriptional repressor of nem operon|nr:TetR/AcrR family transcriptional regulator [Candidatus Angelobacter sp.]
MARPKEFDTEVALSEAMDLFWSKGYEATSMSDLVEHLGLARQSVYDTFGDKHDIYMAALRRYCEQRLAWMAPLFRSERPVRAVLREYLEQAIEWVTQSAEMRGCMLINAAVGLSSYDEEARKLVADTWKTAGREMVAMLRRAQERGEIGAHQNPLALARFFASVMTGILVLSKATRDRQALQDVAEVALKILG